MAAKYFDLQITSIQAVGATCTNFSVQWEDLDCMNQVCEVGSDGILHVQVPEDCDFDCAVALITCLDECTNCIPIRVTVCPCVTDADCDSCSSCINNLCVSICDDDETCVDGRCVDCVDDDDCEGDLICVNGECVCPDGLYLDKYGNCVPCLPDSCPPCYICDPDLGCIPKDCGDGICDPDTGDCVECLGDGDCDGDHEECVDGECVCEDGYIRNSDGECVPEPCTSDDDCPPGYECKDGVCVPIECPDGYILIGEDCYELCTCGLEECPVGKRCESLEVIAEYFANNLDAADWEAAALAYPGYCICIDSDLFPDDGDCNGPCGPQNECPEGCGCVGGVCVDCEDIPCDNCPSPNCVCVGSDCLSVESPECTDSGELELILSSCDLKAEYTLSSACACGFMTLLFNPSGGVVATDPSYITVGYDLEVKKGYAPSPDYALNNLFNVSQQDELGIADNEEPTSGTISVKCDLYAKRVNSLGGVDLGTPDTLFPDEYSTIHTFNGVGTSTQAAASGLKIYKPGEDITRGGFLYRVQRTVISIKQSTDFVFPNGCTYELPPAGIFVGVITFGTDQWNDYQASVDNSVPWNYLQYLNSRSINTDDTRDPLFTWYRTMPNVAGFTSDDIFREVYVSKVGGKYIDTLYGPDQIPASGDLESADSLGELYAGFNYAVMADCACSDISLQSIQAKFCSPDDIDAAFEDCNNSVTISDFTASLCDVNRDINEWIVTGPGGYNIPSEAQVYFDLYINGALRNTYRYDHIVDDVIVPSTSNSLFTKITYGEVIDTVKIVIRTGANVEMCEYTFTPSSDEVRDDMVAGTPTCVDGEDYYTVVIDELNNPTGAIDGITAYGGTTMHNIVYDGVAHTWTLYQTKGDPISVLVHWADGCTYVYETSKECCELAVEITSHTTFPISVDEGLETLVAFLASHNTGVVTWTLINKNTGAQISSEEGTAVYSKSLGEGSYTMSITDEMEDCPPVTLDFVIQENIPQNITIDCPSTNVCKDAIVTLKVTSNEALTVQYNIDKDGVFLSGPHDLVFTAPGEMYITVSTGTGGVFDYDFISPVGLGECTITVEGDIVPTIVFDTDPVCSGSSVGYTITGEPNSTATVTGLGTINIPVSGTVSGTWTPSLGVDTHDISISTTSSSGCVATGVDVELEVVSGTFNAWLFTQMGTPTNLTYWSSCDDECDPASTCSSCAGFYTPTDPSFVSIEWTATGGVTLNSPFTNWWVGWTHTSPGTITATVTTDDGCVDSISTPIYAPTVVEIQEVGPPVRTITEPTYIAGISVDTDLQADIAAGVTYAWTEESAPMGGSLNIGASTNQEVTINPDTSGNYTLRLTVTNSVTGEVSIDEIDILAQVICEDGLADFSTVDCVNDGLWLTTPTYAIVAPPADTSEISLTIPITVTDCDGNVVAGYPTTTDLTPIPAMQLAMIDGHISDGTPELVSVTLDIRNPVGPVFTTVVIPTNEAGRETAGPLTAGAVPLGGLTYSSLDPLTWRTNLVKQILNWLENPGNVPAYPGGLTNAQVLIDDCTVSGTEVSLRGTIANSPTGVVAGINTGASVGGTPSVMAGGTVGARYIISGEYGNGVYPIADYMASPSVDLTMLSECGTTITIGATWPTAMWQFLRPEVITAFSFDTLTTQATLSSSFAYPTNGTGMGTASCMTTTWTLSIDPCDGAGTYQWQNSADLGFSWSDIVGETGIEYIVPYGSTDWFRIHVTCPNGCSYYLPVY